MFPVNRLVLSSLGNCDIQLNQSPRFKGEKGKLVAFKRKGSKRDKDLKVNTGQLVKGTVSLAWKTENMVRHKSYMKHLKSLHG